MTDRAASDRFDIGSSGQQVHVALGTNEPNSSRHPCFRIESPEALLQLQRRIWEHYERQDAASPKAADKPGGENSGKPPLLDASELALDQKAAC